MKSLKKAMVLLAVIISCLAAGVTVQAASGEQIKLKQNVTYKYDVTGDKKADKILIKVPKATNGEVGASIYVNGKLAYKVPDKTAYFYTGELLVLANQKPFLYVEGEGVNDTSYDCLFQYKSNKLKKIRDFQREYVAANYQGANLSVSGNKVIVEHWAQSFITGGIRSKFYLVYKNGTLVKSSTASTVTKTNCGEKLTLRKNIRLYQTIGNRGKSVTVKKGQKMKVLKICNYKEKSYFYGEVSGRKGWFTYNWGSSWANYETRLFEETYFAG